MSWFYSVHNLLEMVSVQTEDFSLSNPQPRLYKDWSLFKILDRIVDKKVWFIDFKM